MKRHLPILIIAALGAVAYVVVQYIKPPPLEAEVAVPGLRGTFVLVGRAPAPHSQQRVQVEEFYSFRCPHCNEFRELTHPLHAQYKDRVEFVERPVAFSPEVEPVVRLYHLAERSGKGEQAKERIFDANFKQDRDVRDPAVVLALARDLGLEDAFREHGEDADLVQIVRKAREAAQKYRILHTPTLVLQGALRLQPRSSLPDLAAALQQALDDLLAPAAAG